MNTVIIGIFVSVLTTLITQYVVRRNFTDNVKDAYRKKYFEKQFECYLKLWTILRPLSRYYDDKTIIKYDKAQLFLNTTITYKFIDAINDFFFSELGIFLSRDIRKEIFELRNLLREYLIKASAENLLLELSKEESKKIKDYRLNIINHVRSDIGVMNVKFDIQKFGIDNFK